MEESSFLKKKKKKTIEAELIYNVVLMSLAQQSDSVIHTYIYICVCVCVYTFFFIFFSIKVYYRILNTLLEGIEYSRTLSFIYFTYSNL